MFLMFLFMLSFRSYPETNSSSLKINVNGRKTTFLLGPGLFSVAMLDFREGTYS